MPSMWRHLWQEEDPQGIYALWIPFQPYFGDRLIGSSWHQRTEVHGNEHGLCRNYLPIVSCGACWSRSVFEFHSFKGTSDSWFSWAGHPEAIVCDRGLHNRKAECALNRTDRPLTSGASVNLMEVNQPKPVGSKPKLSTWIRCPLNFSISMKCKPPALMILSCN